METMIEVQQVSKAYGALEVLRDVSFQVHANERVALTGPSGCGKSTLLNIVGGLDRLYKGHIAVCGQAYEKLSDSELSHVRNQKLGFVFQAFHLIDHLSCVENVLLSNSFAYQPLSPRQAHQRATELLQKVGLAEKIHAHPTELSGGQKQRVAVARALFGSPQLLLCDEPTGSLDADTAHAMVELFVKLNQDGLTMLWVTHDERLQAAATRVIHLANGVIVS